MPEQAEETGKTIKGVMFVQGRIKTIIDIAMSVLLLFLMAYMLTGQKVHEWMGTAMLVLFLLHNILNCRWYMGLIKGKYSLYRIMHTAVNFALLAAMIGIAVSGTILSQFVVGFLPIHGGTFFARKNHMLCSYWAFLLMSVHLGMHWGIVVRKIENLAGKAGRGVVWNNILRLTVIATACYGAYAFIKNNLLSYMLLQNLFVFFDPDQPLYAFLAEYAAMMAMWACAAYYGAKAVQNTALKSKGNISKYIDTVS